ncbi:MAG: [Fe-Fe] hydrogenase large subunit C-terminal domain-containing protein, partial [Anaerovoracaceae bacterium]
ENRHPELKSQISTCKSPMEMFSSLIKEDHKIKMGALSTDPNANVEHTAPNGKVDRRRPYVVAIMPCTAKKDEAARDEFTITDENGQVQATDLVLTTKELGLMIKQAGIEFEELEPEAHDLPFGMFSGAGVIFGVTGGVTEAVIRRLVQDKTNVTFNNIEFIGVRGLEGVKEVVLNDGDAQIRIAIVNGLNNVENLIKKIELGEVEYHFVEVMACPMGCINGGGQPRSDIEIREDRSRTLYKDDKLKKIRHSDANPFISSVYKNIIKDRAHELLHVHYK